MLPVQRVLRLLRLDHIETFSSIPMPNQKIDVAATTLSFQYNLFTSERVGSSWAKRSLSGTIVLVALLDLVDSERKL